MPSFPFISPRPLLTCILTGTALAGMAGCSSGLAHREIPRDGGFQEMADRAGIKFRMRFLPEEQGEVYKVNIYDHGCGLAVGDYNGDGFDDVYFLNQLGRNALYRNRGDGTFVDATDESRTGLGDRVCVGATFDDYDNDGDQDLYVTSTRGGNVLFQNQGNGTFIDVTAKAGLTHVGHAQTPVFFDADGDGYLDLFVTNTAEWTGAVSDPKRGYFTGDSGLVEMAQSPKERNLFYHNNGNGTFTDRTAEAGLAGLGWGGDVAVFDYDDDGKSDLFVTNMFGRSQLYRNLGGARFVDVTRKTLHRTSFGAIGAKAFDYNNDGRLDLMVADMHSDMWMATTFPESQVEEHKKYRWVTGAMMPPRPEYGSGAEGELARKLDIHYKDVVFGNTLYRNDGQGRFTETSDRAGTETFWPWGIASGDFNNDGFGDAFIPSGMGYPYFYWRNNLLMNNGNGTFTERSGGEGMEPPPRGIYQPDRINGKQAARSSRCAVAADFDHDGRLDLMTNNFNDQPYYFRNRFTPENYVEFALTGTRSNRDAVGAVVRLCLGKRSLVRQVDAAGGYLSRGSKLVHFGLGTAAKVDRVEIRWPSGARQVLPHPAINTLIRVKEGVKDGGKTAGKAI